jgi:diadenylate cyclase
MTYWLRFLHSTPTLSVTGIIDLLVVAVVVYQCLMVVRGTRAGHILVGILVMVSLYAVAAWAGLEALRSVLETIVPFLGLAIIVLFASEIRRTLARIGRKRWFGLARGYRAPEAVSEIQMAMELLAQQQIGALIVLERDIGLRTFIESGVRLDALVSRDLLLSIFQPGPPLHDGAVVVQKDRVAAAACFLPLTTQPTFARKLGTRHRAAIGITEETDCLALVVSEETGRISVASFGEMASGLTVAEMMERIHHHFGAARPTAAPPEEFPAGILLASAQPPATDKAPQGRTLDP